jgi:hypothetical protein
MTTEPARPREYGIGFILALVFLPPVVILLWRDFVPQWLAQQIYVEGRCQVLDKHIVESPPREASNSTYRPEFLIRYTVDGREYQTWAYDAIRASTELRWPKQQVLERFTLGQEYPCWYDPSDPSRAILVRGYSYLSYVLLTGLAVLVFLIAMGMARQRRNANRVDDELRSAESGTVELAATPDPDM